MEDAHVSAVRCPSMGVSPVPHDRTQGCIWARFCWGAAVSPRGRGREAQVCPITGDGDLDYPPQPCLRGFPTDTGCFPLRGGRTGEMLCDIIPQRWRPVMTSARISDAHAIPPNAGFLTPVSLLHRLVGFFSVKK